MKKITLYTTHCPACNVLEKKLKDKSIEYDTVDEIEEVIAFGEYHNISSTPILVIGDEVLNFPQAIKWISNIQEA